MPANTTPIFCESPQIEWGSAAVTAANTATDGTGTVQTIFTADATDGSNVIMVGFRSAGTNVQTVARLFINNGSTNATAANNMLLREVTLPATTGSNSAALPMIDIVLNISLPAGYMLNWAIGTAVSAGWRAFAVGGRY